MHKHNIAHLYATGDSFVFGQGLKGHNISEFYNFTPELRKNCYTGIIADIWKIPHYTNTALPGGSNDRIIRKIMFDIPELLHGVPAKEVFVHVGLTHPSRTEFFTTKYKHYIPHISQFQPDIINYGNVRSLWELYVAYFDDVNENVDRYTMQIVNLQTFLKSLGVRYMIARVMSEDHTFNTTVNASKPGLRSLIDTHRFPQDILPFNQYVQSRGCKLTQCLHADEEGHRVWAEFLMNYMEANRLV